MAASQKNYKMGQAYGCADEFGLFQDVGFNISPCIYVQLYDGVRLQQKQWGMSLVAVPALYGAPAKADLAHEVSPTEDDDHQKNSIYFQVSISYSVHKQQMAW